MRFIQFPETTPDHVGFLFLEKMSQNIAINAENWFKMIMSWLVFPNFSQNMNLTGLGSVSFEIQCLKVCFEYWIILGWDIGKTILIFHWFLVYFYKFLNSKVRKNHNSENFGNSFETFVTLVSKWPGISKIYPPIFNYKMLCVLTNNRLHFNSFQGTPCM